MSAPCGGRGEAFWCGLCCLLVSVPTRFYYMPTPASPIPAAARASAPAGEAVRSIAAGRVVFADWLRGFGNLVIVDHGDAFLSVYGNNQSLFRQVGDSVKAGETLATVGSSGGNPQSGLYFELRHQGLALDPLKWVVPK